MTDQRLKTESNRQARQRLLIIIGLLLAFVAPFKLALTPAQAADACQEMAESAQEVMPCCKSHIQASLLTIAPADKGGCCCEEAPVVPGNMQPATAPNSSGTKFVTIKFFAADFLASFICALSKCGRSGF